MQILPINVVELVGVVLGCLMVLIPVAGLTARYALKPIVEAIARMREGATSNQAMQMIERRMSLLEQEMQQLSGLRDEVGRLVDEVEFQRKLTSRRGDG